MAPVKLERTSPGQAESDGGPAVERELTRAGAQGGGSHADRQLDDALADSFPASDPPACVLRCAAVDRLSHAALKALRRR